MTYPFNRADFGVAQRPMVYTMLYYAGETNHCPGCGGTHWQVGRSTAECARCGTAMQLARINEQPMHPMFTHRRKRAASAL